MTNPLRQDTQIQPSKIYDDTFATPAYGSNLETTSTDLEDDLNALRTQVKRILGKPNWHDDPTTNLDSLDHNDLTGLQGGTTDEYFHLTSQQYGVLPLGSSGYSGQILTNNGVSGFWSPSSTLMDLDYRKIFLLMGA